MWWAVVGLLCFCSSEVSGDEVSCKDMNNNNVDWFILYKAPWIKEDKKKQSYMFMTKEETSWMDTSKGVSIIQALNPTLSLMFSQKKPDSLHYLSYNDQPPGAKAAKDGCGHSKGLVMADSSSLSALWIAHSTPQFPYKGDFQWPTNAFNTGQIFLCVSLKDSDLPKVANHLKHIKANIFDRNPTDFLQTLTEWEKTDTADDYLGKLHELSKFQDTELKTLAKKNSDKGDEGDLYRQLAENFGSNIKAQTWNQVSDVGSSDKVEKIVTITTSLKEWTTLDHSKWAVTEGNLHWTCIGDSNRAEAQYKRPGGALCIQNEKVHQQFKRFIKDTEKYDPNDGAASGSGQTGGKRPSDSSTNDDKNGNKTPGKKGRQG